MAAEKIPAMQWYPGDWRKDTVVQSLSLECRGAWRECIDLMWESPERGYLVYGDGKPIEDAAIARLIGCTRSKWKQIKSKLVASGVASLDRRGALYNRRMVRLKSLSEVRAEAGKRGGRAKAKGVAKADKRSPSSSSSASAVEDTVLPLTAFATEPAPGAGKVSTSPSNNGPPPLHAEFMPLLRELGYQTDATDGSILKALAAKGYRREAIEAAVRGLALLRDDGALQEPMGVGPGERLNLRMLYTDRGKSQGIRPWWNVAGERYWKDVGSTPAPLTPTAAEALRSAVLGRT